MDQVAAGAVRALGSFAVALADGSRMADLPRNIGRALDAAAAAGAGETVAALVDEGTQTGAGIPGVGRRLVVAAVAAAIGVVEEFAAPLDSEPANLPGTSGAHFAAVALTGRGTPVALVPPAAAAVKSIVAPISALHLPLINLRNLLIFP